MSKLCECGCGLPAPIAPQTVTSRGYVKGQPLRYRHGHGSRGLKNAEARNVYEMVDCGYLTPCMVWVKLRETQNRARKGREFAYRRLFEAKRGQIPDGHVLHHLCENMACVNPDHLMPVSRRDHFYMHSKLTREDVEAIRKSSARHVDLARIYDVSASYIANIRAGRAWAHI